MRQALQLWPVHDPGGKQASAALISATLHDGVVAAAVVLACAWVLSAEARARWLERTRDKAYPLNGEERPHDLAVTTFTKRLIHSTRSDDLGRRSDIALSWTPTVVRPILRRSIANRRGAIHTNVGLDRMTACGSTVPLFMASSNERSPPKIACPTARAMSAVGQPTPIA